MATHATTGKISAILLKNRILDAQALAQAEDEAQAKDIRLEKLLVEKHLVPSDQMTLALAEYLHIAPISLAHFTPNPQLLELIPRDTMNKRLAIPVSRVGRTLTVALGDPFDLMAIDEINTLTGLEVCPLAAPENEIKDALARVFADATQGLDMEEFMRDSESDIEVVEGEEGVEELSLDQMLESAEGAPVIRMVNMMLVEALRTGASDIHIEPMEKQVRLRYRIDGKLTERPGPPENLQAAVISRIKIMSDLDIAERRIPQDGRFNIKALGREVDLRVSILPTSYGEKVVMRILDKAALAPSLSALGLDKESESALAQAIVQPHGIILVTGPTGSGKTTTLYSCLQDLNRPDVNIITCEDPVEYQLRGINQVQINADVGLTFASSLRSILRQDPDIVLVGEIRDSETAEIAIKAALTGHLVLSTLHTNDAPGAVTRLVDMGVEPFMLSSCLILAQAQRLYRKVCTACRKPATIAPELLALNDIDPAVFEGVRIYRAVGCPRCTNGYKGRGAIMEVLTINEAIKEAILRGADSREIRQLGRQNGMITLKESGILRVKEGLTTLEAALEITGSE
jgi:type IV pilus assembly protein PilB